MDDAQLALRFPYRPALTAIDFIPHPGVATALEFLNATASWPQRRLALWGDSGAGKTHLLHIWAHQLGAALIDGRQLEKPFWPGGAVALDDADDVPDEAALLHVLNAAAEAGHPVLLAMSRAPGRTGFKLPDLVSRLRAITAIEIGPAGDDFLATLFERLLSERQLQVAPAVQAWIRLHLPRTPDAIRRAVAQLDYAALAAKKPVSQKMAETTLANLFHTVPEISS